MIDILIPNYNNSKYIVECLESVVGQKINYKYKIFIRDDCSTDNSVELINEFIKNNKHLNIHFEQNESNKGPLFTTIKLYEKITQQYWTLLDGDDYWLPEFLNSGMSLLINDKKLDSYSTNTKLLENGILKSYWKCEKKGIYTNNPPVFTHTSSIIFSNKYFINGVPKIFYDAYESGNKYISQSWEGDTARNFIYLYNGTNYFDLTKFGGVYRITKTGRWTGLNDIQQKVATLAFKITALEFSLKYNFKITANNFHWFSGLNKQMDELNEEIKNNEKKFNFTLEIETMSLLAKIFNKITNKILFIYLPLNTIGGYEKLFADIAKSLLKDNYYIKFFDSKNFMKNNYFLNNNEINLINIEDPDICLKFIDNTRVLCPFTLAGEFIEKFIFNTSVKYLFHIGHPKSYEFLNIRLKRFTHFSNTHTFVLDILGRNNTCLLSMDEICAYELNKKFKINMPILPVFIEMKEYLIKQNVNSSCINIGFLGRLDSDKIWGLINLIDCLQQYNTSLKKKIHIIGDGKAKELINLDFYKSENIEIIITGLLVDEPKNIYIKKNIDIMFTAGLACLEQPFNGIPSVMIPHGRSKFYNESQFTYLFNMSNYNGGYYIDDIQKMSKTNFSNFGDIIDDIYKKNLINELGNKCANYIIKNHIFNLDLVEELLK